MSWTKLEPPTKAGHYGALATASVSNGKFLSPHLRIGLTKALILKCGGHLRADVSLGEDENDHTLLLEFKKDGAFAVSGAARGAGYLTLHVPGPACAKDRPKVGCRVDDFTPSSVIVHLPMEAWAKAETAPAQPAAPATPAASPPAQSKVGALDMITYLEGKGRKASRIAGGRFMIDGIAKDFDQALRVVNSHRQEAGLGPLGPEKVW